MHFIKSLVSFIALTGFAAAQYADDEDYAGLSRREVSEIAQEEYLAARDEYIEKRDLFRRAGPMGVCQFFPKTGGLVCVRGKSACGICRRDMKVGQACACGH
ncbi:unnamed protein product [Clonostachys rosea]|uniref:Invertebrate defensins family profile domain-containing protein n=1 Tax=Bionectria ochroleuca TaxID=29856 RepID=A0ABY6U4A6_BIOOC|nr:unnamed protein product [Clonostachys rosea]